MIHNLTHDKPPCHTENTTPVMTVSKVALFDATVGVTPSTQSGIGDIPDKKPKIIKRKLEPATSNRSGHCARKGCGLPVFQSKHGLCPHHYWQWYREHHRDREKQRAVVAQFFKENTAKKLYWTCRLNARRRGYETDLNLNWFQTRLDRGVCEVTGLPFVLTVNNPALPYHRGPHTPSIDRINPKAGYWKSNCRLVIWQFNLAKGPYSDATVHTLVEALWHRAAQVSGPAP